VARGLLLALDLGTTSVRALLVEPGGAVLGRHQLRLPVAFPAPGRVEQDPELLFARSIEVLAGALSAGGATARDVSGLGIATQRATALAWEAGSGKPLAPALGWQDQRVAEGLRRLRAEGLPLSTQPAVAKFLWWLEQEPAVQAAAGAGTLRLGTPDAWLGDRLSGGTAHVTDPGQAGCTALYDPRTGDWAHGFLERLGIEARALPQIVASAAVVAETPPALLGAPVPIAARAGDQQAAAFAAGVRAPGQAKLTLGTAAMLDLHTGNRPATPPAGTVPLPLWRLPARRGALSGEESHCLEGHVATAGAALDWAVSLGLARDVPALETLAASTPDAGGVVAVPAFQGLGTPYGVESARGLVGGLTRGSGAAEIARAFFEGVAHRCTDVWETLAPADELLRVDGGLARSRLLLGLLADFSGCVVLRARELEGTALGAAALAGLGVGADPGEIPVGEGARVEPRLAEDARRAARARWRALVPARLVEPSA
jgi:glycerol kinase